eukprot:392306_1
MQKKMNPQIMDPLFANSTSHQITKSYSLYIKLSIDGRFTQIANILRELHAHESTSPKKQLNFQKMASEMMSIIYWTYLIWRMYKEITNIKFLTSASSFGYTKMTIGNMKISHQMEFATTNIKFKITLELEPNGTLDICDFCM